MYHGIPAGPSESFPSADAIERTNAAWVERQRANPDPRGYVVTLPDPAYPGGRAIVVRGPFPTFEDAAAARENRMPFDDDDESAIEIADPQRVVLDARELINWDA